MQQHFQSKLSSESGLVVIFFAMSLLVVGGFAAVSIDWGVALDGQRRAQFAADAGAHAGALRLGSGASYSDINSTARNIAGQNGLDAGDITGVECGTWAADTGFTTDALCSNVSNAVRVFTKEDVATTFGRMFGLSTLTPRTEAVALVQGATVGFCVKPFGIYLPEPEISNIFPNGDGHFTVGSESAGNWGKLDIGGLNASSGQAFDAAMLDPNWCNVQNNVGDQVNPEIGDEVNPGTGFGGSLSSIFEQMIADGVNQDLVIAVNTQFPNGNSGTVTLLEFITVDLISQSKNGSNWEGEFVITSRGVIPPTGSTTTGGTAVLVD